MNKDYLGPIPETRSTFHLPESGEEADYFYSFLFSKCVYFLLQVYNFFLL